MTVVVSEKGVLSGRGPRSSTHMTVRPPMGRPPGSPHADLRSPDPLRMPSLNPIKGLRHSTAKDPTPSRFFLPALRTVV